MHGIVLGLTFLVFLEGIEAGLVSTIINNDDGKDNDDSPALCAWVHKGACCDFNRISNFESRGGGLSIQEIGEKRKKMVYYLGNYFWLIKTTKNPYRSMQYALCH